MAPLFFRWSSVVLLAAVLVAPATAQVATKPAPAKSAPAKPAPAKRAAAPASPATLSGQRLKALATMLMACTQDNNNVYPAMQTPARLRKALDPYAKLYGPATFLQPGANKPYLPNPLLSGVPAKAIKHPEGVVAFYEPVPAPDGSRLVCTADGRVGRMPKAHWAQYKQMLRLP